ncbi:hypothetical protein GZL_02711 [Streptomyces sp. 769]|nr:hypothetical protein GZL_02711 [Streptomyces sp. 769]
MDPAAPGASSPRNFSRKARLHARHSHDAPPSPRLRSGRGDPAPSSEGRRSSSPQYGQ